MSDKRCDHCGLAIEWIMASEHKCPTLYADTSWLECASCYHPDFMHKTNGCTWGTHHTDTKYHCPCTRTYESLTQIDKQRCKHCGLLGDWSDVPKVGNMTREIDSRNQTTYWHDRCYESLVGEKQAKEQRKHEDKMKQIVAQQMETEPSLSLLVCDFGESCCIKAEKGEWQLNTEQHPSHPWVLEGDAYVYPVPFADLRQAIEQRPVPRIERDEYTSKTYRLYAGSEARGFEKLYQTDIDALSELAGKPLPIWKGGTWEEVGHIDYYGRNNADLRVWRYKSNA